MNNVSPNGAARRALLILFAAAVFGFAAEASAQSGRVPQEPRERQAKPSAEDDEDEGEDEAAATVQTRVTDPATILRRARFVYVRSDSAFISGREVEDSLRKRKEFQAWGMVVTRDATQADLIIEITRKPLTRRFTFSVIDPHTSEVVASGKTRSVIFGKKIANKVAEKFTNRVKVYRPYK